MAKKRNQNIQDEQRQTRKDVLIARKQAEQTKRIRFAMGGVAALLLLVFLIAIINEVFVTPRRAVAVVGGDAIALNEWQERVRYERAQRIIVLENQLEAFDGDVGIVQQFGGQVINELLDPEGLAQNVLDQMVNEKVAVQLAEARDITVSEADVDEAIGEVFNYYGGESPPPAPTATETVMPTPSIAPIAFGSEAEAEADNEPTAVPTTGPTSTPPPTATPVSTEYFEEQRDDLYGQFKELGVDANEYREVIRAQLYQERLMDALAAETSLARDVDHVSLFYVWFDDREQADNALGAIDDEGYLATWNRIRSAPAEEEVPGTASELQWRTQEDLAAALGDEVAQAAFQLSLNEPSEIISRSVDAETSRYYIIQVNGRELRPLSENAFQRKKFELMSSVIDSQLAGNLESTEFWRNRIPTQPVLDSKFLAAPTPTPPQPSSGGDGNIIPALPTPSDGS